MEYNLTKKQKALLVFINDFINEYGFSPSYLECAEAMGLASKSGIHNLVHALVERGHIRILKHRGRSIQVTSSLFNIKTIPFLGKLRIDYQDYDPC